MELVAEYWDTYGLNRCLEAVGLSKGTYHYRRHHMGHGRQDRDAALKERIISVIENNPSYGYRRISAELTKNTTEERVNHKRLRRVLSSYELGLKRCLPLSRPSAVSEVVAAAGSSANLVKGRSLGILEAFSTDFSELFYDQGRKKAWMMVLLDIHSRWAGGFSVGASRSRTMALEALDDLRDSLLELAHGRYLLEAVIHHDKDSVYTSYLWLERLLLKEKARISYAERGAKDNPWIESFWGRFKTENSRQIMEAETLEEVRRLVTEQLEYYNRRRRHSALGYRRPYEVVLEMIAGEDTRP